MKEKGKNMKKKPYKGTPEEDNIEELDEAFFKKAKPFKEVFPELYTEWKRGRGRPKKANPKREVKLRIDPDVLEVFKSHGSGWQTRMNDVLKAWAKRHPA